MNEEPRIAIEELFNRYAEALDRKRWGDLEAVFSEEVEAFWPGGSSVAGRADLINFIRGFLDDPAVRTHHQLGNFRLRLEGDRGDTSVYSRSVHQRGDDYDESLGLFVATVVRTSSGWRFERFEQELLVKVRSGQVFDRSA